MDEQRIQAMADFIIDTLGEERCRDLMQPMVDWHEENREMIERMAELHARLEDATDAR